MAASENSLKPIWDNCAEILKEIDRVCGENDIRYSLCGGTVIGAMLYQDFVPWDDDADLMMDRKNYDRFLALFPKKAKPQYRIIHYSQSDSARVLFAKVADTNTVLYENMRGTKVETPLFVDITVMDELPGKLALFFTHLWGKYLSLFFFKYNHAIPKSAARYVLKILPYRGTWAHWAKKFARYENRCRNFNRGKRDKYGELLSPVARMEEYERSLFDEYTRIPFHGLQLSVVKRYEDYLFQRYGKRTFTKEMPKDEQQVLHYVEVKKLSSREAEK